MNPGAAPGDQQDHGENAVGVGEVEELAAGWCETVGAGEYVGIEFRWHNGTFQWRHVSENVAEWTLAADSVRSDNRLQQVACAMGVLVHDSALRLARGRGPNIHNTMSKVGKAYATVDRSKWTSHTLALSPAEFAAMDDCWTELIKNDWQQFEEWARVAYVASDATLRASAMVLMESAPAHGIARPRDYPMVRLGNSARRTSTGSRPSSRSRASCGLRRRAGLIPEPSSSRSWTTRRQSRGSTAAGPQTAGCTRRL
jgi:hypothetical protein